MIRLALVLLATGCAGSLSAPRGADPRCVALDDSRGTLAAIAQATAPAAAAGAGLAGVPGLSPEARLAIGATGLVAGAVATYAGVKGAAQGDAYARECTRVPSPAAPAVLAPPPGYGNRVVTAPLPLPGPPREAITVP